MRSAGFGRLQTYLVLSGALVATAVVAVGIFAGWFFRDEVLARERNRMVRAALAEAREALDPASFATIHAAHSALFAHFVRGLPEAFRIKVWDPRSTIIWSNEAQLIGSTFVDNAHLNKALQGTIVAELRPPTDQENIYERNKEYVAEVYVPITFPGDPRIVGVVETYEDATAVIHSIRRSERRIWTTAAGVGATLYVALAFVVFRASSRERRAIRDLAEQNRELASLEQFARAVLRPLNLGQAAASIVERAGDALGLRRAAMYRADGHGDLTLVAGWPDQAVPWPASNVTHEAITARTKIVRGGMVTIPLFTRKGTAYVFVAELRPAGSATRAAMLRMLDIMLHEAAIVLRNVELFTEVQEAHERLNAILTSVTDRIVILDRDMRVVWMNSAAATASGEDALGRGCFEVFHGMREACDGCPAVLSLQSGKSKRGVQARPQADGSVRYLDLVTVPLCDGSGEPNQVLEVARDVTEMVELQERLKQSNGALRQAQAQLVEKERLAAVGQVVISVRHEILNPLTGILGALQVLKEGFVSPEQQAQALAEAETAARKVEQIVRRLSELRRADDTPYVGNTTMLDLAG